MDEAFEVCGEYIGKNQVLNGKTALLRIYPSGKVLAQFDDLMLEPWCFNWHEFVLHDFELDLRGGPPIVIDKVKVKA